LDSQLALAAFHFQSAFGNRLCLRCDQFHKRRRIRLPPDLSRRRHAPLQIVPRHMQLLGGSINPFLPGHLDSRRPKLCGYSGFPSAIASPSLETPSCFFQGDNRGLATSHRRPPHRISGGRTTLTVINGPIHASLPQTHVWSRAERNLREWRNKQAHLQRLPDSDLTLISEKVVGDLNCLLEAVSFIGTLPLCHVVDYEIYHELDQLSSLRIATVDYFLGISPIFPRARHKVESELARGAVGVLNQRGKFLSAKPWLTMGTCPVCKRQELFVFNRYEHNEATFVAMESGHPHQDQRLAKAFAALIAAAGATGPYSRVNPRPQ